MDRTLETDGGQRLRDQWVILLCSCLCFFFFYTGSFQWQAVFQKTDVIIYLSQPLHSAFKQNQRKKERKKANKIDRKLACFHLEASTHLTLSNSFDDIMYAWFMSQLSQLLIRDYYSRVYNHRAYNSRNYNRSISTPVITLLTCITHQPGLASLIYHCDFYCLTGSEF